VFAPGLIHAGGVKYRFIEASILGLPKVHDLRRRFDLYQLISVAGQLAAPLHVGLCQSDTDASVHDCSRAASSAFQLQKVATIPVPSRDVAYAITVPNADNIDSTPLVLSRALTQGDRA